uniref:L-ornithine N(5)-oxygenase n=1 Tax=Mycena chlorophos TaxID=658473 RepID=A0ABQ0LRK6_MYCCL|nr:predicted protein [Mycena chlorophos]
MGSQRQDDASVTSLGTTSLPPCVPLTSRVGQVLIARLCGERRRLAPSLNSPKIAADWDSSCDEASPGRTAIVDEVPTTGIRSSVHLTTTTSILGAFGSRPMLFCSSAHATFKAVYASGPGRVGVQNADPLPIRYHDRRRPMDPNVTPAAPGVSAPDPDVQARYISERKKRLRADGPAQFVTLSEADSAHLAALSEDPWADHAALNSAPSVLNDGDEVGHLVLGAGYGGLLFAVRLLQSGAAKADDLRMVDDAAGFGGTWYWNRYPGLMCDVESYIYMPLLEETGYMPKHRYAYGDELRLHAERIAEKWALQGRAQWRTKYRKAVWDGEKGRWDVSLEENRGRGEATREFVVHARFVYAVSGPFVGPHIPRLEGLDAFAGKMFHTSRWDYAATGGTPQAPESEDGSAWWDLPGLKGKRVGIIGTGATAIQVVPQLARNAAHPLRLPTYPVVCRYPWPAANRPNRVGDVNRVGTGLAEGPKNLVDDGWTWVPSYNAVTGGEATSASVGPVVPTPEGIGKHVGALQAADLPRMERIRKRVDEVVANHAVAEKLKPWYPTWCKRPAFHDHYLPSFNRPNVTLVDTDGKGVDRATTAGLVVAGTEYPLDVLVLSTGYVPPGGSPAKRSGCTFIGKGEVSLDDVWVKEGAGTLHGFGVHGFPNLFFAPLAQGSISANFAGSLDVSAQHVAYIISTALARGSSDAMVVEVSREAQDAWVREILQRAAWFSAVSGCTPGYLNGEGARDRMDMETKMRMARSTPWGEGIRSFEKVLRRWREDGALEGYVVTSV